MLAVYQCIVLTDRSEPYILPSGKCSKWLLETSNVTNLTRFPMPLGKALILFSRKLNIVKF